MNSPVGRRPDPNDAPTFLWGNAASKSLPLANAGVHNMAQVEKRIDKILDAAREEYNLDLAHWGDYTFPQWGMRTPMPFRRVYPVASGRIIKPHEAAFMGYIGGGVGGPGVDHATWRVYDRIVVSGFFFPGLGMVRCGVRRLDAFDYLKFPLNHAVSVTMAQLLAYFGTMDRRCGECGVPLNDDELHEHTDVLW